MKKINKGGLKSQKPLTLRERPECKLELELFLKHSCLHLKIAT